MTNWYDIQEFDGCPASSRIFYDYFFLAVHESPLLRSPLSFFNTYIMEKLLQWAVNNSNQEELKRQAEAIRRGELKADQSKFDPAVIEAILGKDDATRMKGNSETRDANRWIDPSLQTFFIQRLLTALLIPTIRLKIKRSRLITWKW